MQTAQKKKKQTSSKLMRKIISVICACIVRVTQKYRNFTYVIEIHVIISF